MKRLISFFLFISFLSVNAQLINSIPVPGSTSPTLTQARDEFYTYYTTYCQLSVDN